MGSTSHKHVSKFTLAGALITLGIVFGDIGTSPLYVMSAIIGKSVISPELVLGGISCVFWTLTIQTTFKYVFLTLNADNNGEGGIFALYALVRRRAKWLTIPAVIGGCALLADGIITPSISVTSAVEGFKIHQPNVPVIPIVLAILTLLFLFQRMGTTIVGKYFGYIMLVWFVVLGWLGVRQIIDFPSVFKALSPFYAINLLVNYPGGFWLLGAVFLCTTGAEALYSDLGHCGRKNIQISWIFVKITLILNYFGQGAWLLSMQGQTLDGRNPFYYIMPSWFLIPGILLATFAAIIASQALISGSYTLISEAVRLNLWPRVSIVYPTAERGQLYIPSVNWLLFVGCIFIVWHFEEASKMEAAYGIAITLAMLSTTTLLHNYLFRHRWNLVILSAVIGLFFTVEFGFLLANTAKLLHGGFVAVLLGGLLFMIMYVWFNARKIKNQYTEFVKINPHLETIKDLSEDESVPKYATNLVYLTSADHVQDVESKVLYSILKKQPKRADIYWLVHVDWKDSPHTLEYSVEELLPGKVFKVDFHIGFRIEPKINLYLRQVIEEMACNQEVDLLSRYPSLRKNNIMGDFRFIVIERILNYDYDLGVIDEFVMQIYSIINKFALSDQKAFGLDSSNVAVEMVPLILQGKNENKLKRI
ncbi:MAG: KUP/HAK/KT family potassium transporter [Bacteroidia bacterium]|nr:KUP/HAK/KT family potassium transporter [Bacteroidia bacterium]